MEWVDAHCHFDFAAFDGRRQEVLAESRKSGMRRLVIPGVRRPDWQRVKTMAAQFDGLDYCLGLHPWFVSEHAESDLDDLRQQLLASPAGCVALGECGLDRLHGDLEEQMPWFEAQVDIAGATGYPLVIHSVKTHDEVHSVLRRKGFSGQTLVHGFSGSFEQASKLVDQGCFIGIGGVITHPRAAKTRTTVARLPLEALVLETDAPDMPPQGVAKGENSPVYIPDILMTLAELRRQPVETVAAAVLDNACRFYGWSRQMLSAGV